MKLLALTLLCAVLTQQSAGLQTFADTRLERTPNAALPKSQGLQTLTETWREGTPNTTLPETQGTLKCWECSYMVKDGYTTGSRSCDDDPYSGSEYTYCYGSGRCITERIKSKNDNSLYAMTRGCWDKPCKHTQTGLVAGKMSVVRQDCCDNDYCNNGGITEDPGLLQCRECSYMKINGVTTGSSTCDDPYTGATTTTCNSNEQCIKETIKSKSGNSLYAMTRGCWDKACKEKQTGLVLGKMSVVRQHCCNNHLCNATPALHTQSAAVITLSTLLLSFFYF